jgi:hypothetical protein
MLLLGLGGAVGYVMGTRAGRGRYLEMKNMWERTMNEGSLQEMGKKLQDTEMGRKLQETKIGETLGMKGEQGGTSYGTGSTWESSSSGTGTTGSAYATGTTSEGFTDLRDSADDSARLSTDR